MKSFAVAGLLAAASLAGLAAVHAPLNAQVTTGADGLAHYGSFGFDADGMDKSAAPGDDFYAFANGHWTATTPIPADKASYGSFDALQDLSRVRTRGILEAAQADPTSKIGRAYAAYLDTATIEAKGLAPIKPWLARIAALNDKAGYPALLAEASRNGLAGPLPSGVGQDAKNPDAYVLSLRQGGLGMPDRDYYLSDDPKQAATRAAYQRHLTTVLTLAGEPNAEARAAAVVAFETEIAKVSWTRTQSRDADRTYNRMTVAELAKAAPGFDFAGYFRADGTLVDTVVVSQPSAVTGIAALVAATPLAVLKDQLTLRSLDDFAGVLPAAFDKERFAFFGTALSGTPEQEARWKRGVSFTETALTDDLSKLYVAKYFPPATKAAADDLVKNVIAAMNGRIERLTWMAAETKVKAHAKLAAFTPRIGYPTQWRDYATLDIRAGDAFGNALRAKRWQHDYNTAKLGKPIYRWEWGLTPMTVNAQANSTLVAITFPAAIIQPPFFDPKADPAVNYGAIGAVIGHEMSHHFDDQGAKYDLHGKLGQWWTDEDVKRFNALEDRLVAEYDAYEPQPGRHINGRLTLGENSADLAGLAAALDAYHASLGGKPAPVIDGYTGDQRFFLGWAQVWRRNYREPYLRQLLLTDPHSANPQRAWIVRNMDAWYAAFGATPSQKLYLTPDQRVRIW